jgi:integrase
VVHGPRQTAEGSEPIGDAVHLFVFVGEILALRWEDLDLAAARPTLTICGTLVYVKGQGIFRQPWTKSDAGYRMLVLPRFAVGMLMARNVTAADNPHDAIFASRRGTWLSPTTSADSGVKPGPTPTSTGSPHTASVRPWPP